MNTLYQPKTRNIKDDGTVDTQGIASAKSSMHVSEDKSSPTAYQPVQVLKTTKSGQGHTGSVDQIATVKDKTGGEGHLRSGVETVQLHTLDSIEDEHDAEYMVGDGIQLGSRSFLGANMK